MSDQKHVRKLLVRIGVFKKNEFPLPSSDDDIKVIVDWILKKVDFGKGEVSFRLTITCSICGPISEGTVTIPPDVARVAYTEDIEAIVVESSIKSFLMEAILGKLAEEIADLILTQPIPVGYGNFLN